MGTLGEALAEKFLVEKGFHIVEKNVRFKKLEADILALEGETLVVVEVKTRQTAEIGEPWRAVTRSKQKQLVQVANYYVQKNNIDREVRFDIVSIVHNSYRTVIEHIEEAFYPTV